MSLLRMIKPESRFYLFYAHFIMQNSNVKAPAKQEEYSFPYIQEKVLILPGWQEGKEKQIARVLFFLGPHPFNLKEIDLYYVSL